VLFLRDPLVYFRYIKKERERKREGGESVWSLLHAMYIILNNNNNLFISSAHLNITRAYTIHICLYLSSLYMVTFMLFFLNVMVVVYFSC